MEYSFIIREAKVEDAEDIKHIMDEAFGKYMKDTEIAIKPKALLESLDDIKKDIEQNIVFIAIINDIPVGSVRISLDEDGQTAWITRFGVSPNNQNMGIGKSLMSLVDKYIKTMGRKYAKLTTASKYFELVRFYYGRGFYVASVEYSHGYARALMIKEYN